MVPVFLESIVAMTDRFGLALIESLFGDLIAQQSKI
jgi:hypothetical protein